MDALLATPTAHKDTEPAFDPVTAISALLELAAEAQQQTPGGAGMIRSASCDARDPVARLDAAAMLRSRADDDRASAARVARFPGASGLFAARASFLDRAAALLDPRGGL
jgi:hypothetical protein